MNLQTRTFDGTEKPSGRLYKTLVDGKSFHGGDTAWPLPTQNPDGTWEPGAWLPEVGNVCCCQRGYHLTTDPGAWWGAGATAWIAEGRGASDSQGDKTAFAEARLLRPATHDELAEECLVLSGQWSLSGSSTVRAYGSSTVRASDSSTVRAYGSSTVTASDSSTVAAYDSSTVTASDSSTVAAYDSSTVAAYDSSTVTASDSSTVTAYGSSTVRAYDSSTVRAYDSSTVRAYGSSTVRAYDSSTVRASDSSTVAAYDSSTVRAYGSSTVTASDSSTVTAYGSSTVAAYGFAKATPSDLAVCIFRSPSKPRVVTADGELRPVEVKP